jgi:hypothetical protein
LTTKSDHQKEQVRPIPATLRLILTRLIKLLALHRWSFNPEELILPNRGQTSRRVV